MCERQSITEHQKVYQTSWKLKSHKLKEGWMKNDEAWMKNNEGWWRMMKDEWRMIKNDEGWRMNDEWWRMMISSYWGVLQTDGQMDRQMDEQTDICDCRVAFVTEK